MECIKPKRTPTLDTKILSGMAQNISCVAVLYNMMGGHQEVLVCALIVDIAYTENRVIELFLQRLYFTKAIS